MMMICLKKTLGIYCCSVLGPSSPPGIVKFITTQILSVVVEHEQS